MSVSDIGQPSPGGVRAAVLTISDSRTVDTDTSGRAIRQFLENADHQVAATRLVPDDPETIVATVTEWTRAGDIPLIVTTGGTGIAARDSSADAIARLFDKPLPGFGELFRMLSYQEIGPAAMLSRATAGVIARSIVFVLPGSEAAVRLAMTRLILPEAGHLVRELQK